MTGAFRLIASLNMDNEILVVGGGEVGERKIRTLLSAGAAVTLVSPQITETLAALIAQRQIKWHPRLAAREDFKKFRLAILACGSEAAAELKEWARQERTLIDVCSDGESGDFALCSQFESEGCYIGVSSGGSSPARAAQVRREIMRRVSAPLVLLTRGSPLAMAQADRWRVALEELGIPMAVRIVQTHGDFDRERDLAAFGGFGAFVKALEEEMLAGRGDGAAHSLKDMPVALPEGLELASVLPRDTVWDVLVTAGGRLSLADLPTGARVGTSSLRRRAQVLRARPDLVCLPCRGNVGTRLEKLARGEYDAIILAEAGLDRLGLRPPGMSRLPFLPAPGQGIIALELPSSSSLFHASRRLNHEATWCEASAERELLRLLGLGCSCPVAVNASLADGVMRLACEVYSHPGGAVAEGSVTCPVRCDEEARALADELFANMSSETDILSLIKGGAESCL